MQENTHVYMLGEYLGEKILVAFYTPVVSKVGKGPQTGDLSELCDDEGVRPLRRIHVRC